MKQKKFGKKITNWHRPLGQSQIGKRYRRMREEDPTYFEQEQIRDYLEGDEFWSPYDPHYEYYSTYHPEFGDYIDDTSSEDLQCFFFNQFFEGPSPVRLPQRKTIQAASDKDLENICPSLARKQRKIGIEKRVAAYIDMVNHISDNSVAAALRSQIVSSVGDLGNGNVLVADLFNDPHLVQLISAIDDVNEDPRLVDEADFSNLLCLFAPFWLSRPHTFDERGLVRLLDHLFVQYEVPMFLYPEWFQGIEYIRFKWISWFIILGQGGSLKRASKFFNWFVPAKFQNFLLEAPPDASPVEACIFAEVKRLGGTEIDFMRIHRNRAFVIDPTEVSAVESHPQFWRGTVRWLISHGDEITHEESDLILSWAMHKYTEAERTGMRPFSWKGRNVRTVVERSTEYIQSIRRPWLSYKWKGIGLDWVPDDLSVEGWSFVELTSGQELFHEGQALHHCVSNYAARCASGYSSIVSMRRNGLARVTIEIAPKTRQIVQARGLQNRDATAEEKVIISQWMRKVVRQGAFEQAR